jgi:DNA-binding transcriptional LysR family regulator
MRGQLAFSAAEGVREAILADLGIAIVSEWMMSRELADGSVVPALKEWTLPEMELWAVFPNREAARCKGSRLQLLVRCSHENLKKVP